MKKLLHKDPKMRPGIKNKDEIKNDPFFKDIDWKKLTKRQIQPPIHLTLNDSDNEEEAFLQQRSKKPSKPVHVDEDYTEDNKNLNRLKQYTFITGKGNETDAKLENPTSK